MNHSICNAIYNKVSSGTFLYWYAVVALLLPNIALCFTERLSFWAGAANVLLPLALYMWFFSVARCPGKMVWWAFLFVFFAAFQLVLLYLFGTGVIAVDMFLNLVTTNSEEVMELLDNLLPAVVGVFVIYLPLLILAVIHIRKKHQISVSFQHHIRKWVMEAGSIGLFCLLACYVVVDGYRMRNQLYPVNVCYNLYLAFERNAASENYQEASRNFRFDARSGHDAEAPEVYVMVVGETARAHNFSLYGYPRNTNPLLSKTPGITVFPDATTQSNTTHKSVPMLLSAASAEDFPRLFHEKGILAAFREAGFHTVFISNQLPNHSFIDFLGEQADEHYFLKKEESVQGSHYDEDLLRKLDKILPEADASSSAHYRYRKLFVVLHTYGSHFNYQERYPRSFAYFKPDGRSEAMPENRRDLLNAYDNTIRYTDYILHGIVERLQKWELVQTKARNKPDGIYCQPTSAMLYTSDHGENIFDDNRNLFLHAAPKASDYELHVPFIIWTSQGFDKKYPKVVKALADNHTKQVQTSLSVFHTLLGIGDILTRYRQDEHSVASELYHPGRLLYLDDHNEAIPQDEAKY
ncbi:sulfatase-like hydrolase/transferase [Segatella copri]|uniref:phosphoethanolamine transferase n=1 Tax=Segatella copri TaxID=165179 RepID=UPI003F6FE8F7